MRFVSHAAFTTWLVTCMLLSGFLLGQEPVKGLFLGDQGHHQPMRRFLELQPTLLERGIELTYTQRLADLNKETLGQYDVLVLYANIDRIEQQQADALMAYVESGGGFVPLHCATFCFRNVPEMVALMGAQFQRHGTGVFRTTSADSEHPIMQGFEGFESWDETYVHHLHNEKNRTVLEYRVDDEGKEPWTWVRSQGKGRVFYTAWGHDQRTWTHPGFQNLVERGIRWAAGKDLAEVPAYRHGSEFEVPGTNQVGEPAEFEYIDVGNKIPNYTKSNQWGTQGQNLNMMQKPLAPAESVKHMVIPEGFHVELFASEPDLKGKPICMAWDERGRLWVSETYDYPNNLQPPGQGRDRIRICEDTDRDGKADKFTVFAENLSIPTSIAFYRGGVLIQNGIETLYLKDTDGDDKADQRKLVYSGWEMGDTHGGISNFQYGLDNWIWGMQGYNNSRPRSKESGETFQNFRQGFFRMKPDGSEVEFLRSTNNNTWGLGFSEEGIVFGSTANGCPSVHMPIPNRYYERVLGWTPSLTLGPISKSDRFSPVTDKVRQVDFHGRFTAGAGHALYTARSYPKQYWNRVAFVNGPTGHLTATFVLNSKGTVFRSENKFNLLASHDEWTAPIMSEVGPDGQVWVIDWYNYIVQHNPTPKGFETGKGNAYATELRDKKYGRIYRVVADGSRGSDYPDLAKASPAEWVEALRHPTMLVRKHAQRLLVERQKKDVTGALVALVNDRSVDEIGLNVGAIHALWTLHGLGEIKAGTPALSAAQKALSHPSAGVRRNAIMVLPNSRETSDAIVLNKLHRDTDFQVRLAALLSFADTKESSNGLGKELIRIARNPVDMSDRWLTDALTCAAATHSDQFLQELTASKPLPPALAQQITVVAEHHARSPKAGTAPQILASLESADPSVVDAVIAGFAKGLKANRENIQISADTDLEKRLLKLFQRVSPAAKSQMIGLTEQWKMESFKAYAEQIVESFITALNDEDAADSERVEAADQLVRFRANDDKIVEALLDAITPQTPPAVVSGIIRSLGVSQANSVGSALVNRLGSLTPGAKEVAMVTLLKRRESVKAVLSAAETGKLALNDLALDQRQSLLSHPSREIRERTQAILAKGGGMINADRELVIKKYLSTTQTQGDPTRGKAVFKEQCSKCHIHGTMGVEIGPNLTGMSVHPKDELLNHILDPSRDVESNFRAYKVVTIDGALYSGMLAAESKTTIELVDTQGERKKLLREDVEELVMSRKSVMPEGFESSINLNDMANLLEFLTQKGKYVPLNLEKVATVDSTFSLFYGSTREDTILFKTYGPQTFFDVPFEVINPYLKNGKKRANAIVLEGHRGALSAKMPKSVEIPCRVNPTRIHILGGVGGWSFPFDRNKSVSMIVRLIFEDGSTEDHELINGVHIADYYRHPDVPGSKSAIKLGDKQVRYLAIEPKKKEGLSSIQLLQGKDLSAPIVFSITVEQAEAGH